MLLLNGLSRALIICARNYFECSTISIWVGVGYFLGEGERGESLLGRCC